MTTHEPEAIRIRGARQNNLKNIDVDIPIGKLTAITGLSGSGKTSLAMDTLYAEGRRRYIETFSAYARQFLDRMDRPDVDLIENVPPAIAVDRAAPVKSSRSTVGTMTELTDYLKLLYARIGVLHCDGCGKPVLRETPESVWGAIRFLPAGEPIVITFDAQIDDVPSAVSDFLRQGFDRVLREDRVLSLEQLEVMPGETVEIVVDRLRFSEDQRERLIDSIEQSFRMGAGAMNVWAQGQRRSFTQSLSCAACGIVYRPVIPNVFSFNSPIGACPVCKGFGRVIDIDMGKVIPDPRLTLAEGAIRPFGSAKDGRMEFADLESFCRKQGISLETPFDVLSETARRAIIEGEDGYYGVKGFFEWLESRTYKMHVRVYLSRYRSYNTCPACRGSRLKPEALRYRIAEKTISEVQALSVSEALSFFRSVGSDESVGSIGSGKEPHRILLDEIMGRLSVLEDVGLGYVTIDRASRTLSGGESQRVALASVLGASLVNTLTVLDEPSVGLHPQDGERLTAILKRFRDKGNTVVVVEHDPEIIRQCDRVIEIGPGAGSAGGRVLYSGPVGMLWGTATADVLFHPDFIPVPAVRRRPADGKWITVRGAAEHNLKGIDVAVPRDLLVCLTGVSGSGKSTFAEDILYRAAARARGIGEERPGAFHSIDGVDDFTDVLLVDQMPPAKSPRANALTYTHALDVLRKRLAESPEAKANGWGPGMFSFNVAGGRCDTCKGEGFSRVEMQFLPDVFISCPDCGGRRFKPEVLAVRYLDRSLDDWLSMTVDEACALFAAGDALHGCLKPLHDVGLGYLRLGQPLATLSGGEAQRLKLSRFLAQVGGGGHLLILDEPTTGLHGKDVAVLIGVLNRLVDRGNTVVVIVHHLDVIKCADWVIDLGPGGGEAGGRVVAAGPPEEVAEHPESVTGRFLKPYLGMASPAGRIEESTEAFRPMARTAIEVIGGRTHNLKNVHIRIPLHRLTVLTGVSGSGKSTLAFDVLFADGLRRYLQSLPPYVRQYLSMPERPEVDQVIGLPATVAIEQRVSHAGRRSTVGTLSEVYHHLRLLFSRMGVPEDLQQRFGADPPDPRLFSFNSPMGACPTCDGLGTVDGEGVSICPVCRGGRLRPEALSFRVDGLNIVEMAQCSVSALEKRFSEMVFPVSLDPVAHPIRMEIVERLRTLIRLGLGYLGLDRSGDTLSGGEAQRIRLAAQLGSNLTGVCYILDEPTIGLHPRDNHRLIDALSVLRDRGNTVIVVEHDTETIEAADWVIDLGPGAGEAGGRVVFEGTPGALRTATNSLTGQWIARREDRNSDGQSCQKTDGNNGSMGIQETKIGYAERSAVEGRVLSVRGARKNNLQAIDVDISLGRWVTFTGVSGSGKSSLLREVICRGIQARLAKQVPSEEPFGGLFGWEAVDRVLEVDHSPIGKTSRSIPATYIGVFDEIRKLFAATPMARSRGYGAGRFSFNIAEGRCPVCEGQGQIQVEMRLLPDVTVPCEACLGKRFNADTLAVLYKGKRLADVLDMTFEEAGRFFLAVPKIRKPLHVVTDIGLGYLRLGQPSPTLSGGEAQRLKLARQLVKPGSGHTLYMLDEPSTGLHPVDIERLIRVLRALVDKGHTVAVIEHNVEMILASDVVVDLGPGAGPDGGRVVAVGTPKELMDGSAPSATAEALRRYCRRPEKP
ncbi:MAG: excinuclease ABC subunit UvrA [Thermodesulfobacteriota bacterium]